LGQIRRIDNSPALLAAHRRYRRLDATAQAKKGASPWAGTRARRTLILVNVYMRDPGRMNCPFHAHRPGFPDHNAAALARYFAVMKALEPPYVQDDDVART
jgi:hypothetical protein